MKFPTRTVNLFLIWILFSLLAIAFIGEHPYLGLAIAIVGGIILGVMSFLSYEPEPASQQREAETEEATDEEVAGEPEAGSHHAPAGLHEA